ncbi:MAG TPA: phosphoenolpyruvate carboxykinase (ATP) [Candidatus Limnocylindrales bacterium]|nr:phosphoenolpyruvate carboxykinase (ATP) [Candidatus Limnocylindrales bacterium]
MTTTHRPATSAPPTGSRHLVLERDGLAVAGEVVADLPVPALYEEAVRNREGVLAAHGPLVTRTGRHTGRSPQDRYVVDEPSTRDHVWWGPVNRPMSEEAFALLERRLVEHLRGKRLYVRHAYIGADPRHRRSLRVVTETAWHNLFAHHLFIRPKPGELAGFQPQFTVFDVPSFRADPAELGTRSETVIALNFARNLLVVAGSAYAGEMKKGIFTVMNYLLPDEGVLPMHCAANVGPDGDVALFFGLSGTGKTSLSTVPVRTLVGDDEHGWGPDGVFNFEGGCYAKLIRLRPDAEPEIWRTTRRFGTIAENVVYDRTTRELDLDSEAITENTRGAYPLDFLSNVSETGRAGHPKHVLLLAADAFGVLPPVARLSTEQALYHFLSGYTAKLAGTEVGVTEPKATFSACFGAPFMPRHPGLYATMLGERLAATGATAWLVNTGWTGGPYGVGSRIRIEHTRAMVQAIFDGALDRVAYERDPVFGVEVPREVPGVPAEILRPRDTWPDPTAYDAQARKLARMFAANFDTLAAEAPSIARTGGPVTD